MPSYQLGQKVGAHQHTLSVAEIPSHSHSLIADKNRATSSEADGKILAKAGSYRPESVHKDDATLSSRSIGSTGGGQAFSTMPPSLAINPIICLYGVFPSRS